MDHSKLTDDELLELLVGEEDRLERAVVDEIILRGDRFVPLLSEIVSNQFNWTQDPPEWWAVVHAANILGAIGTETVVIPLLRALRWADAFDCEWVTEALPSMFGRIGPVAIVSLKAVASDQTSGCFCRGMALDGLGMIAWRHSETQKEIAVFIHGIFNNKDDDEETRQFAGDVLLDLKCTEYKDDLLAFGKIEEDRKDLDRFYSAHFFPEDVERAFRGAEVEIGRHERDWLSFYDKEEIQERQHRWKMESEEKQNERGILLPEAKIGRNEPCPCGSGKKYKKCCLGKV